MVKYFNILVLLHTSNIALLIALSLVSLTPWKSVRTKWILEYGQLLSTLDFCFFVAGQRSQFTNVSKLLIIVLRAHRKLVRPKTNQNSNFKFGSWIERKTKTRSNNLTLTVKRSKRVGQWHRIPTGTSSLISYIR